MKNKIFGIGLILGGLLQITRMIPIAMSDGIKMLENFPPHSLEDTINAAHSSGWYISHIMVFLATPLLMIGFYGLYKLINRYKRSDFSIPALIVLSIGLLLYNIGAVIDGLFLPLVCHEILEATDSVKNSWSVLGTYTHELAVNFGGLAFAHLLLGTGLLSIDLNKVEEFKIFGVVGMAIGLVALIGYISGVLDLMVTGSFMLTGGLTMMMFIYFFLLGFKILRIKD